MAEFIFGPALLLGLIIGLYEAFVINRDVAIPTHKMGHMMHALILSTAFVFASMNIDFLYSVIPQITSIPLLGMPIIARIVLGAVAAFKIHAVSRVVKTGGVGKGMAETWFHSFLVGGLVAAAPYIYPVVEPMLPGWLNW